MFRKFCYFLLGLLLVNFSQAQKPSNSLLWEVSGNGLKTSSYLFGTFHIMCRKDFAISPELKNRLSKTAQFYGELKMDDPDMQATMMRKLMSETTLQSKMSAEAFDSLSNSFQKIAGLPLMAFNNFKPFICLSMLAINSVACSDKVQPETEFVALAKAQNMPILGLETIEDQLAAIEKQPLDEQIKDLRSMLLNFDSVKNMMQDLLAVYQKRNVDELYSFMKKTGANGDFEKVLLINRNNNWVPKIEKAIQEKPSFFAVGAGHLGGQEGILELLRKRGYLVTPINY